MRGWTVHPSDFWTGALFVAVAALFIWSSWDLESGTLARVGPGIFPRGVAVLLGATGLVLLARSLVAEGEPLGRWGFRSMAMVTVALVAFGLAMGNGMGLVVAGAVTMVVGSFSVAHARWLETLAMTALVVTACSLLFVVGLGLPFPLWPDFH